MVDNAQEYSQFVGTMEYESIGYVVSWAFVKEGNEYYVRADWPVEDKPCGTSKVKIEMLPGGVLVDKSTLDMSAVTLGKTYGWKYVRARFEE